MRSQNEQQRADVDQIFLEKRSHEEEIGRQQLRFVCGGQRICEALKVHVEHATKCDRPLVTNHVLVREKMGAMWFLTGLTHD